MQTSPRLYKIRDKRKFLLAAMSQLAGDRTYISFEGDLSHTALSRLPEASAGETEKLKRNTLWPKQDFVIIPLEEGRIKPTMVALGGTVPRGLLHIQIEKDDVLEMGLYDQFAPGACYFGPKLTAQFFSDMESDGIVIPWTEGR